MCWSVEKTRRRESHNLVPTLRRNQPPKVADIGRGDDDCIVGCCSELRLRRQNNIGIQCVRIGGRLSLPSHVCP